MQASRADLYANLFAHLKQIVHVLSVVPSRPYNWLGVSVVERRSLTGELSLVCTGPAADG